MDVGELRPHLLTEAVGDEFSIAGVIPQSGPVVLERIVEHRSSPGAPRSEPFTLTFVGDAGDHLPQSTYTLEHPTLGSIEIFLVPRGPGADGRHRYDAVFN